MPSTISAAFGGDLRRQRIGQHRLACAIDAVDRDANATVGMACGDCFGKARIVGAKLKLESSLANGEGPFQIVEALLLRAIQFEIMVEQVMKFGAVLVTGR